MKPTPAPDHLPPGEELGADRHSLLDALSEDLTKLCRGFVGSGLTNAEVAGVLLFRVLDTWAAASGAEIVVDDDDGEDWKGEGSPR